MICSFIAGVVLVSGVSASGSQAERKIFTNLEACQLEANRANESGVTESGVLRNPCQKTGPARLWHPQKITSRVYECVYEKEPQGKKSYALSVREFWEANYATAKTSVDGICRSTVYSSLYRYEVTSIFADEACSKNIKVSRVEYTTLPTSEGARSPRGWYVTRGKRTIESSGSSHIRDLTNTEVNFDGARNICADLSIFSSWREGNVPIAISPSPSPGH